jgi:THO complex subunit 4
VCLIETRFTTLAFRSRSKRQELFSQVGQVKKAGLNFDQNGRSKGTAEVILARRQDAMQAIKTYNGVKLDGRPLRIELVGGAPGGVTLSSGVTVTGVRGGGARGPGGGKKVVVKVVPRPGTAKAKAQGAKGAGAQGAGAQGAKKKKRGPKKPAAKAEPLTQAQLDAQLDSYKGAAAMEA